MPIFNLEDLEKCITTIALDKYEPKFTVTQLFHTGTEVTLYYVIRNNKIFYYDSKTTYTHKKCNND